MSRGSHCPPCLFIQVFYAREPIIWISGRGADAVSRCIDKDANWQIQTFATFPLMSRVRVKCMASSSRCRGRVYVFSVQHRAKYYGESLHCAHTFLFTRLTELRRRPDAGAEKGNDVDAQTATTKSTLRFNYPQYCITTNHCLAEFIANLCCLCYGTITEMLTFEAYPHANG